MKDDRNDGEAAFYLAESWASLERWEEARSAYDQALARGYDKGEAYYGRAARWWNWGDASPQSSLSSTL